LEHRVSSHDRDAFDLGLGNQEAIERVAMMEWQCGHLESVDVLHRERNNAVSCHAGRDECLKRLGQRELAKGVLDRNFP
jgi:hypothetical protein